MRFTKQSIASLNLPAGRPYLIHTTSEQLTPASVVLGEEFSAEVDVTRKTGAMRSLERLVEIREGLCTGEPVVRDLAELMEEESLIRGTVLGFWNPGERPR